MVVLKWFIVVVYSLLILGEILALMEEKDNSKNGNYFSIMLTLALPIIYILAN